MRSGSCHEKRCRSFIHFKMVFPLYNLPNHLLLQKLRRFDLQSLCRLRKANKSLDNFVESNRFLINARTKRRWFFYIGFLGSMRIIDEYRRVEETLKLYITPNWTSWKNFQLNYRRMTIRPLSHLRNPVKQLSGCYIDAILLDFWPLANHEEEYLPLLFSINAVLLQGRFKSNNFGINNFSNIKIFEMFLPVINSPSLFLYQHNLLLSDLNILESKSFIKLSITNLAEAPQRLINLVKNLKRAAISIETGVDGFPSFSTFLQDIQQKTDYLRNLTIFHLKTRFLSGKMTSFTFLKCIYKQLHYDIFRKFKKRLVVSIFKMQYYEGTAYIVKIQDNFYFHFVKSGEYWQLKRIVPAGIFSPEMMKAGSEGRTAKETEQLILDFQTWNISEND